MELRGAKVLLTGGAGFIGSHLADSLLRMGSVVTVLDNFDDFYQGKEENVRPNAANPRYRLLRGDITDYPTVAEAAKGSDLVFHLAAQAGVRYCIDNPIKANQVNVLGTLNVLNAARHEKVKKFIYASSSSVYGVPQRVPMTELHPLNPTSPYGVSKLAAEKYCLAYGNTYGLPVVCLRYFSVYGPRGRPDQVLYSFAKSVKEGGSPIIYGDGTQSRDFTYVSDVVAATLMASINEDCVEEVFNVGYGQEFSISEAARLVIELMGVKAEPVFRDAYKGDFPRTLCSRAKAGSKLGWTPRVPLEEGLAEFIDWFVGSKYEEIKAH